MSEHRAIIDIGSNTVRLVIYNGPPRAPVVLLNEKVTPRLGRDVANTGLLSEKSMEAALQALKRYAALLRLMDVTDVQTVATAAVRDAKNGPAFLQDIAEIGLPVRLLSGEEEARASAMGVLAAFPGAVGIAGDLGGGSLELIVIEGTTSQKGITLPFGTLRLPALREEGDANFSRIVSESLTKAKWSAGRGQPLFIVGGSWRALALYAMDQHKWPLDDPHDFELSPEEASRLCALLAKGESIKEVPRIASSRMAALPDAAALLGALIAEIAPSRIVFSSWGLREGLLFTKLDKSIRVRDPMLDGVTNFAERYSICAKNAALVDGWIGGTVPADRKNTNLRLATTMLALASMRTEPNLRSGVSMGWALRKRWIGLDARGRAMIAMAVLANTGQTDTPGKLAGLASESDLKWAVTCGLAIRLCRRLTNCAAPALFDSSLTLESDRVVLHLEDPVKPLYSNGAAKDLRNLADWLGVDWMVQDFEPGGQSD